MSKASRALVLWSWLVGVAGCSVDAALDSGADLSHLAQDPDLTASPADAAADAAMDDAAEVDAARDDLAQPPALMVKFGATAVGTADQPSAIATGDFNGDGAPDVAVASGSSGDVAVHLWTTMPRPGLGKPNAITLGAKAPGGISVADIDGDQRADIAVIDVGAPTYWSLLAQGGGQFRLVKNGAAFVPAGLLLQDIDVDGKVDLALSSKGGGGGVMHLLAGDGSGTFQEKSSFVVGMWPYAIAWGTLDGDTRGDLAIADPSAGSVFTALGSGGFTFSAPKAQPAAMNVIGVVLGQFDRDNRTDAVVAMLSSHAAGFMKGGDDGSLALASNYAVGLHPVALVTADFDRDGTADVATADKDSSTVSVLRGYGDGTFHVADKFPTGFNPAALALADFNRDGWPDLVVANQGAATLTVLLNISK